MASPYSKGAQNAQAFGDELHATVGRIVLGTKTVTATNAAVSVTLAFTPDWIIAVPSVRTDGLYTITTSGTTTGLCTFTRAATTVADVIMYIAGDLA